MDIKKRLPFLAAVLFAMSLGAQTQPSLQISSPSSGTIVNPGQTISVSVTSPSGTAFTQVDVISEQPIGMSATATSVPAQLSLTIPPQGIRIGKYMLTAEGITASGQNVDSPSIAIDVELATLPIKFFISDSGLILESAGEQIPLDVRATFIDTSNNTINQNTVSVKESTHVTYSSSNITVAAVDNLGNVTAVGPGNAQVTATYTLGSQTFPVSVPVTVQNQRLTISSTSLSFGTQPVGTTGTPQQLTLTDTATGNVAIQAINTSADFSETDNCVASSPLTPNNSCTVNVTFSPTASGTRAGTLSIANSANIVPVAVALSGTGAATAVLFGDQTVEDYQDTNILGQAEAFQTTATGSGTLGSFTVYLDQGNSVGQLNIGLYTDNGGHPATLLTQASTTQMTAGSWNTIPVSSVTITAGVTYWIAILGSQSGTIAFRDNGGANCGDEGSSQTDLTSLPATWTTGPIWGTCPLSAYGTSQ